MATPKFSVGQQVVFENKARERFGWPKIVKAEVISITDGRWYDEPRYTVIWSSKGKATVRESQLRAA